MNTRWHEFLYIYRYILETGLNLKDIINMTLKKEDHKNITMKYNSLRLANNFPFL